MNRWFVLAFALLFLAITVSAFLLKTSVDQVGSRLNPKVELNIPRSPLMVTATVKFVNGSHERTLGFSGPSYDAVRQEVDATKAALEREWNSVVDVTWVGP